MNKQYNQFAKECLLGIYFKKDFEELEKLRKTKDRSLRQNKRIQALEKKSRSIIFTKKNYPNGVEATRFIMSNSLAYHSCKAETVVVFPFTPMLQLSRPMVCAQRRKCGFVNSDKTVYYCPDHAGTSKAIVAFLNYKTNCNPSETLYFYKSGKSGKHHLNQGINILRLFFNMIFIYELIGCHRANQEVFITASQLPSIEICRFCASWTK